MSRKVSFERFHEYNPNPKNLVVGDCVIRAITKALDTDWYDIYDQLTKLGREECAPLTHKITFEKFIISKGFIQGVIPRPQKGTKSVTVDSFAKDHQTGTFLLSTAHHLICVKDGMFYDLSPDFGTCKVYKYWYQQ